MKNDLEKIKEIRKLDTVLKKASSLNAVELPSDGWINEIRKTICMSRKQLAAKIEEPFVDKGGDIVKYKKKPVTAQAILEFEKSEVNGTITLNSMKKLAKALNLKLVYGFVPVENSIWSIINKRAREVAVEYYKKDENAKELENAINLEELKGVDKISAKIKAEEKKQKVIVETRLKSIWD